MGMSLNSKSAKRVRFAPPKPAKPNRTPEWRLQAEIISEFHKLEAKGWPFTCAGDQNAAKRTKREQGRAKITGMTAGEPDIRVYGAEGRLLLIELKADGGVTSDEQDARHQRLAELGHVVVVLEVKTKAEAKVEAVKVLREFLGRKGRRHKSGLN